MAEYWIVYKDIEDTAPRPSFEIMPAPKPPERVIRSGRLPGRGSLKDLHVKWFHRGMGDDVVHLLTYTHVALTAHKVKGLVSQAYRFAQERN